MDVLGTVGTNLPAAVIVFVLISVLGLAVVGFFVYRCMRARKPEADEFLGAAPPADADAPTQADFAAGDDIWVRNSGTGWRHGKVVDPDPARAVVRLSSGEQPLSAFTRVTLKRPDGEVSRRSHGWAPMASDQAGDEAFLQDASKGTARRRTRHR